MPNLRLAPSYGEHHFYVEYNGTDGWFTHEYDEQWEQAIMYGECWSMEEMDLTVENSPMVIPSTFILWSS